MPGRIGDKSQPVGEVETGEIIPGFDSATIAPAAGVNQQDVTLAQIAAQELSYYANLIQSRNFRAFEAYIVATLLYLALAVALRQVLRWAGPRFLFGR